MADHFTALVVSVEPAVPGGCYRGFDVELNGMPLWFRPYDGADWTEAVNEVTEALCEVLRAHTGRVLPGGEADDA